MDLTVGSLALLLMLAVASCGSQPGGSSQTSDHGSATTPLVVDSPATGAVGSTPDAVSAVPVGVSDVPTYVSSGSVTPMEPFDGKSREWTSNGTPATLAYDMSSLPASQRESVVVALYNSKTNPYLTTGNPLVGLPINYTIETNTANGGALPSGGWTVVGTVTNNKVNAPQTVVDMNGANWLRVNVQTSSDPAMLLTAVNVYSSPSGLNDDWLFMGDSISHISLYAGYANTLAALVNAARPERFPIIIDAATSGATTITALPTADATINAFPGRYVVLAYGTNDDPNNFKMEALVQKVIAAGKTPVIPRMPWASTNADQGTKINAQIDALYINYPQILRGPDLYAAFKNRTDLLKPADVHPNAAGQAFLRQQWADTIAAGP